MPVIAVVNRKGGSGKSTFAAHVAAWCARQGHAVMLGDIDRQQSSRGWLKRRDAGLPTIAPWTLDQKNVLRVPTGITHVVLDTPGGLHGFELARVVMFADAVVIPVCPSVFDREAATACLAEMQSLPRVASGRCKVAAVGMRVDGRTNAAASLRAWAEGQGLPLIGVIRETQGYVRNLERGLTLFDLPADEAKKDLAQWEAILDWIRPVLQPQAAAEPALRRNPVGPLGGSLAPQLKAAQHTLAQGSRLASVLSGGRPLHAAVQRSAPVITPRTQAGEVQQHQQLLKT
ncbi:ParA family protein [Caenimonas sedimenti]|uniref:ParA family protein n=1 Tax=Caenimonas sedimenti TaxID=2596921 RepID=A0A562ZM03_9BURK|nr:ParA family protein [Caenimonas sedimenti]TWO69386.1 ParA family protein [Caenimonas sedimenti]